MKECRQAFQEREGIMSKFKILLVNRSVEFGFKSSVSRIALHTLVVVNDKRKLGRSAAGIARKFHKHLYLFK